MYGIEDKLLGHCTVSPTVLQLCYIEHSILK